jgi:CheY-like chemotaxis protein
MMPDMTGMELHRELQRVVPLQAATMIFMTGGTFTPEASDFLRDVVNRHVEKPFDVVELRALVQEQVDQA